MRDVLEQTLIDEAGLGELQARDEASVLWKRFIVWDWISSAALVLSILMLSIYTLGIVMAFLEWIPVQVGTIFVLVVLYPAIFLGFVGLSRLARWRAIRRVRFHLERPACTACGYALSGLSHDAATEMDTPAGPNGYRIQCPECGHHSPLALRQSPSLRPGAFTV